MQRLRKTNLFNFRNPSTTKSRRSYDADRTYSDSNMRKYKIMLFYPNRRAQATIQAHNKKEAKDNAIEIYGERFGYILD
jgi:hypothetical protein